MQNTLKFCVYKITNSISDKSYIGKTCDLNIRWKRHKSNANNSNNKFPRALRKYPENTWIISILYETNDEDHCYKVEEILVDEYNTFHSGYNSCEGGMGIGSGENHPMFGKRGENHPMFGKRWKWSQEQKNARTGENHPNFGNTWSQEQKNAVKGKNHPMFGIMPWETQVCKSKGLEINWFYLDKVYDLRIKNQSYYGQARIYNKLVKDYPNIKKSPTSFQNMFRWIVKHGNPSKNQKWMDFHNNF